MKAVVLLSGGQDSTTCLFLAVRDHGAENVLALSVRYGQRHASELGAAKRIAALAGVAHRVVDLPVLSETGSALTDKAKPLTASGGYSDAAAPQGLPSSFVPGRNLLFIATAATVAAAARARIVYTGTCQTDFSGYPDCRREFVDALQHAATLAMPTELGPIEVVTPLMYMTKAESVRLAAELPGCMDALAESITCYKGERPGCGECPACLLRAKGFAEAGVPDPAKMVEAPALSERAAALTVFENPGSEMLRFECPEFTSVCPATGQPDFATIRIWYKPSKLCVELKALKLYLWSFRNEGAYHEKVTETIHNDLVARLAPEWMLVEGDFLVRGGIHTVVHRSTGDIPQGLMLARLTHFGYRPNG